METDAGRPVAGYAPHAGGGINNQKMAIIGAFLDARETGAPLALPSITEVNREARVYRTYSFGEIFDEDKIREFAERNDIKIVECFDSDRIMDNYEAYFWKAHRAFEEIEPYENSKIQDVFIKELVGSLRSTVMRRPAAKKALIGLQAGGSIAAVVQLRIELDWLAHCRHNLPKMVGPNEELYVSTQKIMDKIKLSLPEIRTVYFACDQAFLPHSVDVIKDTCWNFYGIYGVFKSDFLTSQELEDMKPIKLSLLDFEIAAEAKIFIGTSRSTFSNMVRLQQHCRGMSAEHFVYNRIGPRLARRTDIGQFTDVDAATAVESLSGHAF